MDAMLKSLLTATPSTDRLQHILESASEARSQNVEELFGDGLEDSPCRWQQLLCPHLARSHSSAPRHILPGHFPSPPSARKHLGWKIFPPTVTPTQPRPSASFSSLSPWAPGL
ncbi:unnamed protein product [Eretmochelys imbricata]